MDTIIPPSGTSGERGVPADSAETRRYQRLLRRIGIFDLLLGLALMGVILAADWTSDFRNFAVHVAGDHPAFALFLYTSILLLLTKFLSLGLDYYSFLIEHRYHLSNQRLRGWAWDQVKGFVLMFFFGQLLVQVIYTLIRLQPHWWWVTGWALFMVLSIVLAQIAPVVLFPLFFRFHALHDEDLTRRLTHLCENAGAKVRGVYEWVLSEKTRKANAAVMGLGRTRRIVISDTLPCWPMSSDIMSIGTCSRELPCRERSRSSASGA
jgi:STE24 endopeptidase